MAENDVPRRPPPAAAAPGDPPPAFWMVLAALGGAILGADHWATAYPPQPLVPFLEGQAWGIGLLLLMFSMAGAMGKGRPLHGLREPLFLVPLYLVLLVPHVASMTVGWEGGWLSGIAGTALGTAAGVATGALFARWAVPEFNTAERRRRGAIALPIALAVLFAVFGAYSWAIAWLTPDQAWAIAVLWIGLALPGILVGRFLAGFCLAALLVVVMVVPLIGSLTVGWEGGWLLGVAGATAGAAAGALKGCLFNQWIMPEYDKRRALRATTTFCQ